MIIEFSEHSTCLQCLVAAEKEKIRANLVWSNLGKKFFKTRLFIHKEDWDKFSQLFAAKFEYKQLI